jgi:hypothetical protein
MGAVASAFNAAFRDYNTDGVPASGNHNVAPSDCRGLGATLESYIASAIATAVSAANSLAPTGRLTLSTGTPVLTGSVAGATSVLYTPYTGAMAPIWNGSAWVPTAFAETTQLLTDTTLSPSPAAASSVYDYFLWSNGGTIVCTRGPAWTSAAARGTGAGTSQLSRQSGLLVNQYAITNGPAAGYGLYVGSVATNASATVDFVLGSAASGGGLASLNLWNMFNRVLAQATVTDSGGSYTYTTATTRAARASNANRVNFLCGLAEDAFAVIYGNEIAVTANNGSWGAIGVGLDSTTTWYGNQYEIAWSEGQTHDYALSADVVIPPQLGAHFIQALEIGDGTHANAFATAQNPTLQILLRL